MPGWTYPYEALHSNDLISCKYVIPIKKGQTVNQSIRLKVHKQYFREIDSRGINHLRFFLGRTDGILDRLEEEIKEKSQV